MTDLAKQLSYFLHEYLPRERRASQNTCETYAYTYQLLVNFAASQLKLLPSELTIEHISVELVVDFLNYLERERGNSARTRNARIAAIKAFFRFLEYRLVSCLDQSGRIQSIPQKKTDDKLIGHLNQLEIQALLNAPDVRTRFGLRDRAMLHLCFAAGLRVSELIAVTISDLEWTPQPTIHVVGKGRRERQLPLWRETAIVIKEWVAVRSEVATTLELFPNAQGVAMTRSGFAYILTKYVKTASVQQPSISEKNVTPHVLRHSCAMNTLKATHDIRKVSLWLGHADLKSTEIYLRADPSEKLEILMEVAPPSIRQGNFKAPDKLLAMLKEKKLGS